LAVFFGPFGIDRFYLGYGVLGVVKLCTLGGCGLWWIVDTVLLVFGVMKDSEGAIVTSPIRG